MNDRVFLDTNIIIYLYSEDETQKRCIAYNYINNFNCVTSIQAMNEASNVWLKKYRLSKIEINKYLDEIEAVCDEIMLINRKTLSQALDVFDRYHFSYYDSLMLSSALESNCDIILTEDMKDGQIINDTLKIMNPFNK